MDTFNGRLSRFGRFEGSPGLPLVVSNLQCTTAFLQRMGSASRYVEHGRRGRGQYSVKQALCDTSLRQVLQRLQDAGYGVLVCEDVRKHFMKLPSRYCLNIDPLRHEDILLHTRLLQQARAAESGTMEHDSSSSDSSLLPQIHVRKVNLASSNQSSPGELAEEDEEEESRRGMPIPNSVRRMRALIRLPKPAFGSSNSLVALGASPGATRGSPSGTRGSPGGTRHGSPAGSIARVAPCPLPRSAPSPARSIPSGRSFPPPIFGSSGYLSKMDEEEPQTPSVSGTEEAAPIGFEITVATGDRAGLLKYLATALSATAPNLNIKEAHVFSTTDGMALEIFVVEGWPGDDVEDLRMALLAAVSSRIAASPITMAEREQRAMREKKMEELRASVEGMIYEDWVVDFSMLEIGEKLGDGYSGRLFRGKYKSQDVAVKLIELGEDGMSSVGGVLRPAPVSELLQMFKQEVAIMRLVRHKNVVQFIGACSSWPKLCIVTELMAGGSVRDVIQTRGSGLEPAVAAKVLRDAAKGMDFLHKRGVVHRDLKAANLLIDEHDVVKVCDFGVARFKPSCADPSMGEEMRSSEMTAETGTYRWMAPEVLEHKAYDHKADVYSFGITMWEVLTGELPYSGLTPLQAAIGVVQRSLRPPIPATVPSRLSHLIERCWNQDPKCRPEFSEIVSALDDTLKTTMWRKGFFSKAATSSAK